jgi:hypothetical protein
VLGEIVLLEIGIHPGFDCFAEVSADFVVEGYPCDLPHKNTTKQLNYKYISVK